MTDFTMKTDADGVALITWDVAGKSMNVMSFDGLQELDALVDQAKYSFASQGGHRHRATPWVRVP